MSIRKRLKGETPSFFKVLRNIAIGAVTVSGVILALPVVGAVAIPAGVIAVATYVTAIGSAVGITSQLTVKDPNRL